jgi:hypothetical protein
VPVAENLDFGSATYRLASDRRRPRAEPLELAVTLAALLIDAEQPEDARRAAWPWLSDLVGEAAA